MLTIEEITARFERAYGPFDWKSRADPLSELVETLLSQHTSDVNSHRAFRSLWDRFGSWTAIVEGDTSEIEEAIRAGGLSKVKAPRVKQVLREIKEKRGSFDLEFL